MQIDEILSNARLRLGDPLPQSPSMRSLFKLAIDHCQSIYNELTIGGRAWATGEVDLTVTPGQGDYNLAVGDWGKPLLVYTQDMSNPSHWERAVPFFELQNLPLAYQGPANGANALAGIAFYRPSGASVMVRIRPVPQAAANYRIVYSVGDWASSATPDAMPALKEHHHLIEVRTAISALPLARWSAGDDKAARDYNQQMRTTLAMTLAADEQRFARDFAAYIRSVGGHRIGFRLGAGGY